MEVFFLVPVTGAMHLKFRAPVIMRRNRGADEHDFEAQFV